MKQIYNEIIFILTIIFFIFIGEKPAVNYKLYDKNAVCSLEGAIAALSLGLICLITTVNSTLILWTIAISIFTIVAVTKAEKITNIKSFFIGYIIMSIIEFLILQFVLHTPITLFIICLFCYGILILYTKLDQEDFFFLV